MDNVPSVSASNPLEWRAKLRLSLVAWAIVVGASSVALSAGIDPRFVLPIVLVAIPAIIFFKMARAASIKVMRPADLSGDSRTHALVTAGAIADQLSATYSSRYDAVADVSKMLAQAHDGDELWIAGISLGDFLCPHGKMHDVTASALNAGVNVRALLLDMWSDAAKNRVRTEEGCATMPEQDSPQWDDWYRTTRFFSEIGTATNVARQYQMRFDGRRLGTTGRRVGQFEARTYSFQPLYFLLVLDNTMFIEHYGYGSRGGDAPMLKVVDPSTSLTNRGTLFQLLVLHFEVLWRFAKPLASDDSEPVTQIETAQ